MSKFWVFQGEIMIFGRERVHFWPILVIGGQILYEILGFFSFFGKKLWTFWVFSAKLWFLVVLRSKSPFLTKFWLLEVKICMKFWVFSVFFGKKLWTFWVFLGEIVIFGCLRSSFFQFLRWKRCGNFDFKVFGFFRSKFF